MERFQLVREELFDLQMYVTNRNSSYFNRMLYRFCNLAKKLEYRSAYKISYMLRSNVHISYQFLTYETVLRINLRLLALLLKLK